MSGNARAEMESSPYLEAFKEKDYDVLLMMDEIDDFVAPDLEYNGKKLKSVTKGDVELDKNKQSDKKDAEKKFKKVIDLIRDELKDDIKDIRVSGRLKDSACCLVADEGDMDQNMERLMKAMGQALPQSKRILEINPSHPLIESMNAIFEKDKEHPILKEYAKLLYDQALLLEGSKPKDPVAFSKTMSRIMVENAKAV